MLEWITVLLVCQLLGEVLVKTAHLPLPGPVGGMALLFCGLVLYRGVPDNLGRAADAFLSNLSLLFIPAGVGVMLHFKLLAANWLPLTAGLIASTLLTIAVTSWIMSVLSRKAETKPGGGDSD